MTTTETIKTQCGRMDHGGCTLLVDVEDGRIVRVRPDPDGPLSRGHICPKARAIPGLLSHPQRLRNPMRRKGPRGSGEWMEISWPEAFTYAGEMLNDIKEEYGGRAVAFCQGSPKGLEHFLLIRLANTFGSPNVVGPQNVCHMPREIPSMMTCGFFPVADYDHPTGCMLVWGSNLTATNEEGVICTRLLGRLSGERPPLIVVDPRLTDLARRADIWLPIKPGTDAALALGFLHVIVKENLIDREFVESYTHGFPGLAEHVKPYDPETVAGITGVRPGDIIEAARLFGRSRPALIQWGNGIEQNHHNFDTVRALLCLMAVTGNLDAPGGNVAAVPPPVKRLGEFVRADLQPDRAKTMLSAAHGTAPGFMIVPPEHFKEAVLTGKPYPVRASYVHVSNPVLAWSDSRSTIEALQALDFLVVTETFMSPTAELADLVLPAATQFEYNDLGHYGLAHGFVLARPRVVDPPRRCLPLPAIINELAKAMGLGEYWYNNPEDVLDEILAPSGLKYRDLTERGILRGPMKYYKYKDKGFKTPTGRVELVLSRAEKAGLGPLPVWDGSLAPEDPDFPLVLTGHKSRHFFCSDHRFVDDLVEREPRPIVEIHSDTAQTHGIQDGDPVMVETETGSIRVYAKITEGISPGVISVVHGWWQTGDVNGGPGARLDSSSNVLTSSRPLNRPFGTPNLRGIPARLVKL